MVEINEGFKLNVHLTCSSTGSTNQMPLQFSTKPTTLVQVKQEIENQLSIPRCVQVLSVPGRYVKSDEDRLSDLYLDDGGEVEVKYSSTAQCDNIRKVAAILAKLKSIAEQTHLDDKSNLESFIAGVESSFSFLSYSCLYPWRSERSTANAKYLDQLQVISLLVEILKKVLQDETAGILQPYAKTIQSGILTVFWNLAETVEKQEFVVKHDGFQLMLDAFLNDSAKFSGRTRHTVGCITNYCETPSCRLQLARCEEAVKLLIKYGAWKSSDAFRQQLVANAFFRVSFTLETHISLAKGNIMTELIRWGQKEVPMCHSSPEKSCAMFTLLLAICRLIVCSPLTNVSLTPDSVAEALDLIEKYLTSVEVQDVRNVEERIDDNWSSILPFIEMAFPPIQLLYRSSLIGKKGAQTIQKIAIFSLIVEFGRGRLQEVTFKDSMQDYAVCLIWMISDNKQQKNYLEVLQKGLFKGPLPVPSLSALSRAKLSEFVGLLNVLKPVAQVVKSCQTGLQSLG